jgi:hypothetical protein
MTSRRTAAALGFAALLLSGSGALAQPAQSAYTDLDLNLCTVMESDDFGTTWACPGYKGIPVSVAEGDLRFAVSYGLRSTEEKAASQTLPPFNYLGPRIEWRLSPVGGQFRPNATVVRYFVDASEGGKPNEVLVVTRLEPGATCHVAYIDATANADANEMARKAADEVAPGFDCENEPETVGEFKAW